MCTETMKTSTDLPVYHVKVTRDDEVMLEFEMISNGPPNDRDVVNELKSRA